MIPKSVLYYRVWILDATYIRLEINLNGIYMTRYDKKLSQLFTYFIFLEFTDTILYQENKFSCVYDLDVSDEYLHVYY